MFNDLQTKEVAMLRFAEYRRDAEQAQWVKEVLGGRSTWREAARRFSGWLGAYLHRPQPQGDDQVWQLDKGQFAP